MTARIYSSGALLGIRLLDHIIVGRGDEYFSFKEEGQMYAEKKEEELKETGPAEKCGREQKTETSQNRYRQLLQRAGRTGR